MVLYMSVWYFFAPLSWGVLIARAFSSIYTPFDEAISGKTKAGSWCAHQICLSAALSNCAGHGCFAGLRADRCFAIVHGGVVYPFAVCAHVFRLLGDK